MPDYFTLPELRDLPDLSSQAKHSDDRCEAAAAYIVGIIEREVGTSFIGRTVTAEVHDGGTTGIVLRSGYVQSSPAPTATIAGVAVTETLLVRSGILYRVSGTNNDPIDWPAGKGNVSVTYTAGYSTTVPGDVKEMALKGTRAHLLANAADSSMSDRRTSLTTDMGVINYVVAGPGRPTGYPEVDAMILGWKSRLDVLGFA